MSAHTLRITLSQELALTIALAAERDMRAPADWARATLCRAARRELGARTVQSIVANPGAWADRIPPLPRDEGE